VTGVATAKTKPRWESAEPEGASSITQEPVAMPDQAISQQAREAGLEFSIAAT
jgi:hypothetical protein